MTLGFDHTDLCRKSQDSTPGNMEELQMDLLKELGLLLSRCSESFDAMWTAKCRKWYDLSSSLFWACLIMNLMLIGLMMGHYFDIKYEGNQWITPYFVSLLAVGALLSSIFLRPLHLNKDLGLQAPLLQREHQRLDID
eukprot:GEMP01073771.1.p1 GENE.GEMP01073771.1~~GEMP01073771.1.p1  ORF type:complete len:138 (+),score=21.90 GEMP01073771.1:150-563(+)